MQEPQRIQTGGGRATIRYNVIFLGHATKWEKLLSISSIPTGYAWLDMWYFDSQLRFTLFIAMDLTNNSRPVDVSA